MGQLESEISVQFARKSESFSDGREGLAVSQVSRAVEALNFLGQPLSDTDQKRVRELSEVHGSTNELEKLLDRYTLFCVTLDDKGFGKSRPGRADRRLVQQGWRSFLVRVENPGKLRVPLMLVSRVDTPETSEGALVPGFHDGRVFGNDRPEIPQGLPGSGTIAESSRPVEEQWMGYCFGVDDIIPNGLEGNTLEYQVIQIYCQAKGHQKKLLSACSSTVPRLHVYRCHGFEADFECAEAIPVLINIRDWDGRGTTASLIIRDLAGRLYPAPGHRLEPDLTYQPQVYRADGETIWLPPGKYRVTASRGPEYFRVERELQISESAKPGHLNIDLKRWIEPASFGWYPGEPNIHPDGQYFGIVSNLGICPETIIRQVRGEALSIGCVCIWAAAYYFHRQFLTGHVYQPTYKLPFPEVHRANNSTFVLEPTPHDEDSIIRYDVEQAGFPARDILGHLMLLGLKNHDYPGVKSVLLDMPSWNLPILKWAADQGAIRGYAHSGFNMRTSSPRLPTFDVPNIGPWGAAESLVTVTHGAVDFVAGGQFDPKDELNFWYHLLNCGFRLTRIGETNFHMGLPRCGMVRTYVRLDHKPVGDQGYRTWLEGIKSGKAYFGDGRSHLMDFAANNHPMGHEPLKMSGPGDVVVTAKVSARLEETPIDFESDEGMPTFHWHLERGRTGSSRKVTVEVVVNGEVVKTCDLTADGNLIDVSATLNIARSSWVALRILPSSHTNPIFIEVTGEPVRVSARSAQWCLDCIDQLWEKAKGEIRETERDAAAIAWDHARKTYRAIKSECNDD